MGRANSGFLSPVLFKKAETKIIVFSIFKRKYFSYYLYIFFHVFMKKKKSYILFFYFYLFRDEML